MNPKTFLNLIDNYKSDVVVPLLKILGEAQQARWRSDGLKYTTSFPNTGEGENILNDQDIELTTQNTECQAFQTKADFITLILALENLGIALETPFTYNNVEYTPKGILSKLRG